MIKKADLNILSLYQKERFHYVFSMNAKILMLPLENDEQEANSGTFETSLIHSVIEKDIDKLKLIINHPSFNAVKSQVKTAIFTAVRYDQIEIFRELLPLVNNDVNISFQNGDSLLTYAVISKSDDII